MFVSGISSQPYISSFTDFHTEKSTGAGATVGSLVGSDAAEGTELSVITVDCYWEVSSAGFFAAFAIPITITAAANITAAATSAIRNSAELFVFLESSIKGYLASYQESPSAAANRWGFCIF